MNASAEMFFIASLNLGQKKMSTPVSARPSNFSLNLINRAGGLAARKNSFGVGSKLITIEGSARDRASAMTCCSNR